MSRPAGRAVAVACGALLAVTLAACGSGSSSGDRAGRSDAPPGVAGDPGDVGTTAYDAALSTPRQDTVYPKVGSAEVDALHYDLHLTWDPDRSVLDGTETVVMRATGTAPSFRLDLAPQLTVSHVWVDRKAITFTHLGKNLVVSSPVTRNDRYLVQLTYSGTPAPVKAPTDRPDFDTTGWTTTSDGSVWTMQEPYGAYTWYAVNDQPSDKAFYDLTIDAPAPLTGVANGQLLSRTTQDGRTVTHWRLPEPASSYLITIAIDHFDEGTATGPHGLPITYWVPASQQDLLADLRYAPHAIAFLEHRLGRFPFPTLGLVVVPSNSAMETQSMVTLGDRPYDLSRDVIVHELAHQWYGDEVTPDDWSDLWMSEGMATYLAEATWSGSHGPRTRTQILHHWKFPAEGDRDHWGPPARYTPTSFAEGNAYYPPALMWDMLRQRLGDREFWRLVRAWPATHRFTSQGRDDLIAWWDQQSGEDLTGFFHRWLLGPLEPRWEPSS